MLENEDERIISIPLTVDGRTITTYYLRVAKEVPDWIIQDMIDDKIAEIRKGMASWH